MRAHQSASKWQTKRSAIPCGSPGAHVRDLIPDIRVWLDRPGGEVDHFLTQVITGHGALQAYFHRIDKVSPDRCICCAEEVIDDVYYTLLRCPRWAEVRGSVALKDSVEDAPTKWLLQTLPMDSMREFVNFITSSSETWRLVVAAAAAILEAKSRYKKSTDYDSGAVTDVFNSPCSQVLRLACGVMGNPVVPP